MSRSRSFQIVLAVLVFGAAAAGLAFLHLQNYHLKARMPARVAQAQEAARLKKENAELQSLLAVQARDGAAAKGATQTQVEQVRAEIDALERKAKDRHAAKLVQTSQDAHALANNRDPRQALTRLEHFQDRGQGTPAAAFETAVWAALRGDEAALMKLGAMSAVTRTQAKEMIARLPEAARASWTPEKLATLWFIGAFTDMPALQITSERQEDAENAILTFRTPRGGEDEKVKMKLSPNGWRVTVPTNAVERLERKLNAVAR